MTPGTKIGDFEGLSRLGEGGMGEVYRARDAGISTSPALSRDGRGICTNRRLALEQFEEHGMNARGHTVPG